MTDNFLFQFLGGFLFFGLWGSFMGAAYFRLLKRYAPHKSKHLSLWTGRSHCFACHKKVPWGNLIPLLSWFFLRGKCQNCHVTISYIYPLIEAITLLAFIAHAYILTHIGDAFFLTLIISVLIIMSLIDLKYFILPDDLQLILFISWFCMLLISDTPFVTFIEGLAGLTLTAGLLLALRMFFLKIRKIDAIGFGDIKLSGIAGLWIGAFHMPWMLLIASLSTLGIIAIIAVIKKTPLSGYIPFGPGLAFGFYVTLLIKLSI